MSELPIVVNLLNEGYDPRSVKEMDELMVSAADLIMELVAALEATQTAIINCRDKAAFSSKDTVVKYMEERLPSIDAALARVRSKGESDERA